MCGNSAAPGRHSIHQRSVSSRNLHLACHRTTSLSTPPRVTTLVRRSSASRVTGPPRCHHATPCHHTRTSLLHLACHRTTSLSPRHPVSPHSYAAPPPRVSPLHLVVTTPPRVTTLVRRSSASRVTEIARCHHATPCHHTRTSLLRLACHRTTSLSPRHPVSPHSYVAPSPRVSPDHLVVTTPPRLTTLIRR